MGFPPLWNVAEWAATVWGNATPDKKASRTSRAHNRKQFPLQPSPISSGMIMLLASNLQPRLTEPHDQVLDQFCIPPLPKFLPRHDAEIRPYSQQLFHRPVCRLQFAKLSIGRRERDVRTP